MDKSKILSIIALNLQDLLNQAELSPAELAKRCTVSAGSLSKIMQGKMSITIPMAMEIAKGLGVTLNNLLDGLVIEQNCKELPSKADQLSVGILSANNKRITCVKNYCGEVIGTSILEGGLDLAETSGILLQLIQESIFEASSTIANEFNKLKNIQLNLVTQSFEFADTRAKFSLFAKKHFKGVMLLPDWLISYLSNFPNKDGISLIADKGVALSYMQHGKLKKLGGWKFPVYDLGGENWLGLEAIRHTIEAKEGYIPMSEFANNVLAKAKFNGKIERITEMCFKSNNSDIYCFFAEELYKNYFTGDLSARTIIEHGFKLIYKLVERIDKIFGEKPKIALSGSLAKIYKPYFDQDRLASVPTNAEKAKLLAGFNQAILSDYLESN